MESCNKLNFGLLCTVVFADKNKLILMWGRKNERVPLWMLVLASRMTAANCTSTDSVEAFGSAAGLLEPVCTDWPCCWWQCDDTGYDSAAEPEEEVESWCWGEESGVPSGSGKLPPRRPEPACAHWGAEPCWRSWEQKPGSSTAAAQTSPLVDMETDRLMRRGHCWSTGWRSS